MNIAHCKLVKGTQKRLIEYFVLEVTARSAAGLLGVHPNTAALFYNKIRTLIACHLDKAAHEVFGGEIVLNKMYFECAGKDLRNRGAGSEALMFGLLERGGSVYIKNVADTEAITTISTIVNQVIPDGILYADDYHSCSLLYVTDGNPYVDGRDKLFSSRHNAIERFWNQAKIILKKYNGISKEGFPLFLKECEFRFNYGSREQQLERLTQWANF